MINDPKNIRAAIFDLDGTLLDSMHVWQEVDELFFRKRHIPMPENYPNVIKHLNFPEAAHYTKTEFSLPESEEEIMREWSEMTAHAYETEVLLKPYAKEYLLSLRERGVKLGVATSSKPALFTPAFERNGINDFFGAIVTTEETKPKSFPDVYLETARRLGVPPEESAVFEDIVTGIISARRAGFYTVAVFDFSSANDEEALRENADKFITSFKELL